MAKSKAGDGNEAKLRQLRGSDLAAEIVHLNGHQKPIKFMIFEPYWAGMLVLPLPFIQMIPFLQSVMLLGLLGLLFEIALWMGYSVKEKSIKAYPGLPTWYARTVRRSVMPHGRPGSPHARY